MSIDWNKTKRTTLYLTPDLHRKVKTFCATHNIIRNQMIEDHLRKVTKKEQQELKEQAEQEKLLAELHKLNPPTNLDTWGL